MAKQRPQGDGKEPTEIVRANVNREALKSDQFVSIYANDTQFQVSPWDVRLVFGVIDELPTKERPTILVQTLAEVRMSPQHAKKVTMVLLEQLKAYEENVGPIPLPTD